ncbi:YeiH family protein [Fictibacillus barbaricus]|uniref:YeiH family putative sulfate export transporter n=1 Tax=Fictibacillus barbaricus TaxID=182136 RepID=A0ABS2ZE73_9BACL|nr:YeiH family protein [Fictibacillus barbaricus]MBN3546472.1 YeiH family putative sulfate export transporter [Fictibacillus barbaricus]GGB41312.1 membrane protein [Fictibacillus barbaricus]
MGINNVELERDLKALPNKIYQRKRIDVFQWSGGIAFTFFIAILGLGLSKLEGFHVAGPLACSIIIAVLYRQVSGYPEKFRAGIEFSSKKLLRFAIILYGLKLNVDVIFQQGLSLLVYGIGTIVFSIIFVMVLAKWFKADPSISLLLGVGTGVCGAAAIAAVSPIIKAKEEDTAIGVGIIALLGTLFAVIYTVLRPVLPLSSTDYGSWAGLSLHEIAHVALAGAPGGEDALAMALLAKLGRVFLLVPLCFVFMYWMKKKKSSGADDTKIAFPWFLVGFIVMSLFGSYVVGDLIKVSAELLEGITDLTTFVLTMAMVGLGLNVSLYDIKTRALKPLLAVVITSILLSFITYIVI